MMNDEIEEIEEIAQANLIQLEQQRFLKPIQCFLGSIAFSSTMK